ncbi:MAG: phosphoribosyltransferase [Symploca sp. SIO2E6]|nr:phosphoribosyltransferase [Symploca sp. SIO2E6]
MSSAPLFRDRADAGEQLAQSLSTLLTQLPQTTTIGKQLIVYALPRGGIPVAAPVAHKLDCPLEIVVAKKITTPQNPELAIGAVTSDGQVLWSQQLRWGEKNVKQREAALHQAQAKAQTQLAELEVGCSQISPQGAIALLIDDGIATGLTITAAARSLRAQKPAQLWICTPVAPVEIINWLAAECDRLVVLRTPSDFLSVSRFYLAFPQVTTQEALVYLLNC